MSYRVEELLHQYGLLERPKKPRIIENEPIGRYRWRLLRNCIKSVAEVIQKQDKKEHRVSHGVTFQRQIAHTKFVKQVLSIPTKDTLMTLDGEYIRMYQEDGQKKDLVTDPGHFDKLLYVSSVDQFVGWTVGTKSIFVLDPNFEILTEAVTSRGLENLVYNEDRGELISSEPGVLISWVFRYGNRHLLPRKHTTEQIKANEFFTMLALECTASANQKVYAVRDKGVMVFNLQETKCLGNFPDLHGDYISAIAFFNPSKQIITGAKDGSIKVWDETFHVYCVFVGHHSVVNNIVVYPYGPMILSSGLDDTIRVWNLEIGDEMVKVRLDGKPNNVITNIGREIFYTIRDNTVDLWKINQLYIHHTTTGSPINKLMITEHPNFVPRAALQCRDGCVHIVNPMNGQVLSSAVNKRRSKIQDSAYSIEHQIIFCAMKDGSMTKFDASLNPAKKMAEWPCRDVMAMCTNLLIYEYVLNTSGQKKIVTKPMDGEGSKTGNKTLLLAGRKDGFLCVVNWETGRYDYEIEGHGNKGVLCLVANSAADRLISAGADNIIKVWRMYPFAHEALAPLMSFFCAHKPMELSIYKQNLMVAFQDAASANYNVVHYNLENKNRFDHSPDDDHQDSFTDSTCCPRLKLFATSSMDGTVRVWNEENNLVRILHLHGVPLSVSFCSERGDLLVGMGNHLYFIEHRKYLPKVFLRKMVMMVFEEVPQEFSSPYDEHSLSLLSNEAVRRIKLVQGALKDLQYHDELDLHEEVSVVIEKQAKQAAFDELQKREDELRLIRDGHLQATKKPKTTKSTTSDAFDKYMKIFYDRPKVELPREPFLEDEAEAVLRGPRIVRTPTWQKEDPAGFFPDLSEAKTTREFVPPAGGYVPNSVLLKLIFPPNILAEKTEVWKPPEFNAEQLAAMNDFKKRSDTNDTADRTMFFDWDEGEEEKEEAGDLFETEAERKKREEESKSQQSDFLRKMTDIMEKPPTPKEPTPEPPPESPAKSPAPKSKITKEEMLRRVAAPSEARKPVVRKPIVRKPLPPKADPVTVPAEVDEQERADSKLSRNSSALGTKSSLRSGRSRHLPSPTAEPGPSYPDFVVPFENEPWFERQYVPPGNVGSLPQPLTPASFCTDVLNLMRQAGWEERCELLKAVLNLHQQEAIGTHNIYTAKHTVIAAFEAAPTCTTSGERAYIEHGLKFLAALDLKDRDVVTEYLIWYFEGDEDIQEMVMTILELTGLNDQQGFLQKELDNWDLWSMSEGPVGRRGKIKKMCSEFLNKWLVSFKIHIRDTIERMKRGEDITGEFNGQKQAPSGILKTDSSSQKTLTVTFDKAPDPSLADNATFIDAINYFCEISYQKKLAKLRAPRQKKVTEEKKNTVLVLPHVPVKPCLVRLGESNCDAVQRRRRDVQVAHQDFTQPAAVQPKRSYMHAMGGKFTPFLHVPMKACFLNPFPSPLDQLEQEALQPMLISLRCSHKYFIPELSVAATDPF